MSIFTGFVVYAVIWWLVLFTVLPWGAHPVDNPEKGHATSAPKNPNLKIKFLVTTVIAAILWYFTKLVIDNDLFNINV